MTEYNGLTRLLDIMRQLRDPATGCPWDIKQDFHTLVAHTIEEAYEVADAIAQGDPNEIQDELGDLLFQVVFYAQLGRERGWFGFDEIAQGVSDKLVRRHPHVFADAQVSSDEQIKAQWEAIKREERAAKAPDDSILSNIPSNLPSLLQALKIQKRCASVGFDWDNINDVCAKVREELLEVEQELQHAQPNTDRVAEEIGDLLFAVVNLARHLKVNPENALRQANHKFSRRFRFIEQHIQGLGERIDDYTLAELETLWQLAKRS
ncbi:nucleoside triphosphate pyrophosphohydrolase [Aliidiomarina maris]|uniref:Nucleoside triphosphate pyrophosphohydrolase n=1 Tax=Aliidiomarina maris TaxID=531312 RepID=A0A327XB81_9GAMM|nr:nucleoside triphosphate pyrophosphohydrolase [Aliidiomarina maris]RAK01476.1 ATP diphosphatase [Aliidiomarina maris]RUO28313.1 nucleoside triphosphate pyrophosphohydrolase [Aliidiomarina maris]